VMMKPEMDLYCEQLESRIERLAVEVAATV
jgi:hypothetical protein